MSCQVLGKRSRSTPSSSSPSRSSTPGVKSRHASVALEPLSPDPTPNPKRVKTCLTVIEQDDNGSNKENIPPNPIPDSPGSNASGDASTSTAVMRVTRRASIESTRSTTIPRRRVASSQPHPPPSSNPASVSPSVSRKAAQRKSHIETPSKNMTRLSLSTPPPTPTSILPRPPSIAEDATTKLTSLHVLARALLRPQSHDEVPLVGREQERAYILDFLVPFLAGKSRADHPTSLYVSGAPGTGKTALVNEVLKSISTPSSYDLQEMDVADASVRVVYVNCMALAVKDVMAGVWDRCAEEFNVSKHRTRGAAIKMDWSERYSQLLQGQKCILVLDEIDHLTAVSATSTAAQFFALAAAPHTCASLRIIGISNTHTLTQVKPSAQTQTVHFEPYTARQMKSVLTTRLASLPSNSNSAKLFPGPTLAILTLKIASQTGDIRTVFSVARRALDIAVVGSIPSSAITVTPAHVLAALKASNASIGASQARSCGAETVTRVRNLGLHARFAMAALLLASRRVAAGLLFASSGPSASSGKLKENAYSPLSPPKGHDAAAQAIDVTALHGFYVAILSRGVDTAFRSVGRTEFGDLVSLLEGNGLVTLTLGRGFGSKTRGAAKSKGMQMVCVASGVRDEELVRGLVGSIEVTNAEGVDVNVKEEEVKRVWEREVGKIGREVKARCVDTNKKADFEGAEET